MSTTQTNRYMIAAGVIAAVLYWKYMSAQQPMLPRVNLNLGVQDIPAAAAPALESGAWSEMNSNAILEYGGRPVMGGVSRGGIASFDY